MRKARVPVETIQENEERDLCEEKTTSSNISNKEGAEVSKIFLWTQTTCNMNNKSGNVWGGFLEIFLLSKCTISLY